MNLYSMPNWDADTEVEFWRLVQAGYGYEEAQRRAPVNVEKAASMRGQRIEEG